MRPCLPSCLLVTALAATSSPASAQQAPGDARARDALVSALERAPTTPQLAVACAPASTVLTTLGQLVEGMGMAGLEPAERELVQSLVRTEGLVTLGIDPEGPLALTMWQVREDPVGVLSLPFAGDGAAARSMLEDLGGSVQALPDQADAWLVLSDDGTETVARLRSGMLDLAFDGEPGPPDPLLPGSDPDLVAGLPAEPGCVAWVATAPDRLPGPERLRPGRGLALAGFVPFERGGLGLVRVRANGPLPAALGGTPGAPLAGTSTEPPSLVLSLGLSAADLLLDPAFQDAFELPPRRARRLARHLNIGAGTTLATFGNPRAFDLVASVPLDPQAGPIAQRRVVRRLARLARKADLAVLARSDDHLVVDLQGTPTTVAVRDGRLLLGPNQLRVFDAAEGRGRPWLAAEDAAWAMQWPVAAWTGPDGPAAEGIDVAVRAGLRARGDVFEVGLQVRTSAPPGVLSALLGALLSQEAPLGARPEQASGAAAPGEDLERAMEGIALAQEVRRATVGSYLALPPAPRPVQAVDAQVVPWRAESAWAELGWAPDPPETATVFWVELTEDGYAVHAATDLDGDGEAARYLRTSSAPMRRTTPDGVE